MEKTLYQAFLNRKMAIEATALQYAKSPELHKRLASVIAENDSIVELYKQAALNKSLVNNKVLQAKDNSKFAQAIRLRKILVLNQAQVDTLLYHTNVLHELWSTKAGFNPKEYERKVLSKLLTDDQYVKLLLNIHREKANKWAQNSWKELKERNLNGELDSAKTVREVTNYYLHRWVVANRYGDEKPEQSASLKSIQTEEPKTLKALKAAKRYNNPLPEKSSAASFAW